MISKCHITDKIEEDWLLLLAQREKGRRRKMCGVYSTGSNGTTRSETENSSLKPCIKNMFNNTCSNNYNCLHVHHLMIKMYRVLCTLHHDLILLCYMLAYVHCQNTRTLKSPGSPLQHFSITFG